MLNHHRRNSRSPFKWYIAREHFIRILDDVQSKHGPNGYAWGVSSNQQFRDLTYRLAERSDLVGITPKATLISCDAIAANISQSQVPKMIGTANKALDMILRELKQRGQRVGIFDRQPLEPNTGVIMIHPKYADPMFCPEVEARTIRMTPVESPTGEIFKLKIRELPKSDDCV